MNWGTQQDDIVYSAADVEDGVKKGVVQWDEVLSHLESVGQEPVNEALRNMETILKSGANAIQSDLPSDIYASAFRTAAIGVMVRSSVEQFARHYDEIMEGRFGGELLGDSRAESLVDVLKDIGRNHVYCTPSNLKLELMGRHIICDLLDVFWEGAKELPLRGRPATKNFAGKAGALISENYRRVFQRQAAAGPLSEQYYRFQLMTDQVCGMTDTYAKRLHSELKNA